MNALGTLPGHNDVINVHELQQIVRGLKIRRLGMVAFQLKSI